MIRVIVNCFVAFLTEQSQLRVSSLTFMSARLFIDGILNHSLLHHRHVIIECFLFTQVSFFNFDNDSRILSGASSDTTASANTDSVPQFHG